MPFPNKNGGTLSGRPLAGEAAARKRRAQLERHTVEAESVEQVGYPIYRSDGLSQRVEHAFKRRGRSCRAREADAEKIRGATRVE